MYKPPTSKSLPWLPCVNSVSRWLSQSVPALKMLIWPSGRAPPFDSLMHSCQVTLRRLLRFLVQYNVGQHGGHTRW